MPLIAMLLTPLVLVAGPMWGFYLWEQIRRARLHLFTVSVRGFVRRNLPLRYAVGALVDAGAIRASILEPVGGLMASGYSLGQALAAHPRVFPPWYAALVQVGERSGQLPAVLDHLADDLEEQRRSRARLAIQLAYPCVVLIVYVGVLQFLALRVLPKLRDIFEDFGFESPPVLHVLWGPWTSLLPLFLFILVFGLLLAGVFKIVANLGLWQAGDYPRRLRAILPVGRRAELARLAAAMAAALKGGATTPDALTLSANVAVHPLKRAVLAARDRVVGGRDLADAFDAAGGLPRTFVWMVRCGEAAGQLPEAMNLLCDLYVQRTRQLASFLRSLIIPAATCMLAAVVGVLFYGVLGNEVHILSVLSTAAEVAP